MTYLFNPKDRKNGALQQSREIIYMDLSNIAQGQNHVDYETVYEYGGLDDAFPGRVHLPDVPCPDAVARRTGMPTL